MGLHDVSIISNASLAELRYRYVCRMASADAVGHAVAPSTPSRKISVARQSVSTSLRGHLRAGGFESRAWFSPSEMALPNHPDTAYEYIKTLKDCGLNGC